VIDADPHFGGMTQHHVVEVVGAEDAVGLDAVVVGAAQAGEDGEAVDADVVPFFGGFFGGFFVGVLSLLVILPLLLGRVWVGKVVVVAFVVVNVRVGGEGGKLGFFVGVWINAVGVSAGPPATVI